MRDTWNDIAMPILRAVQEMEAEQGAAGIGPHIRQLTARLGMSENEVGPQLNSLAYDGYIAVASNTPTMGHAHRHFGITLLPNGRRALGEWPDDPMAALAVALARALEEASDKSSSPDDQSRLRSLANQLREAGPGIAVTLILEGATRLAGL